MSSVFNNITLETLLSSILKLLKITSADTDNIVVVDTKVTRQNKTHGRFSVSKKTQKNLSNRKSIQSV